MKEEELNELLNFHLPRYEELPEIDLYLDQTVTLLENYLNQYIRKNLDEKIITKTMINNYVKQHVMEAPVNKKYSKNHIATLFVICILKQVYSIPDIAKLIELALRAKEINIAYNKFCDHLEHSIRLVFTKQHVEEKNEYNENEYLLKNVVQAFANKLYVEKTFLKKD